MAATLKCDTLQNSSSAVANLSLDTSGNVTGGGTIADSTAVIRPLVRATSVASTSGSSVDFTSIPSWVTRITVMFHNVSVAANINYMIQLGTSSGLTTSGYISQASQPASGSISNTAGTTGLILTGANNSAVGYSGCVIISTLGSNIWSSSGTMCSGTASNLNFSGGSIALSAALTQLSIKTVTATTFDAGTINILYE